MGLMLTAWSPFGPAVTSKDTFWFSFRDLKPLPWIAEKCANRSLPPPSGVMNPKPLESLNHLTVPVAMSFHPWNCNSCARLSESRCGHDDRGRELTATWTAASGLGTAVSGLERTSIHYLSPAAR